MVGKKRLRFISQSKEDLLSLEFFRHLRQNRGSVLLEVIVAIFVFLIVLALVFTILATGRNAWHIEDTSVELQQELRKGLDVVIEDLRQTASSQMFGVPPDGNWYNTITYRKPTDVSSGFIVWGEQSQFLLGGLNGRQLLRRAGGSDEVIANNIVSLGIRRQWSTRDVIEVILSADKTTIKGTLIERNINFQIKLRN